MSPPRHGRLRVLVVDDSATTRARVCEVIEASSELELCASAEDGRRAIELCAQHRPDVITMDMVLPHVSGLEATEHIMAHQPTPILIVSSSTNRGELFCTYDALAAGAVDVLEKPRGDDSDDDWEVRLIAAIKMVARIPVITHPRGRLGAIGRVRRSAELDASRIAAPLAPARATDVIAIGASTGGPGAVADLLRGIHPQVRTPIVVLIHIGEAFGSALADWLDSQVGRRVVHARDGDALADHAGRVAMAPPGHHLVVRDRRLRLTDDAPRHSCRPSVDTLFESIARDVGPRAAACLLTGMGRDGAAGLLAIRTAGGFTVAQDEATSVVYGMPREAALLGAAQRILPLGEIAPTLNQHAGVTGGKPP